jgi:DNA-binding PadR family transcriptional regulator
VNRDQDLTEELPLTEATTYILLSLVDEPKHGYAIMKDAKALSEGRVVLSSGTLYGALSRLLEQGWIVRWEGDQNEKATPGRPRKTYSLTEVGRRVLEAEISRLRDVVSAAQRRTSEATS